MYGMRDWLLVSIFGWLHEKNGTSFRGHGLVETKKNLRRQFIWYDFGGLWLDFG
jgi:hypothetical protein